MGQLTQQTKRMRAHAANALSGSGGKQLRALESYSPEQAKQDFVMAGQELTAQIRSLILESYDASGLQTRTGTLKGALANCIVSVNERGIRILMPSGARYPKGKGDVYAAAGVYRYGGVRQPITEKAGSTYTDLPTGEKRKRKTATGVLGEKLKRSVKAAVLKNGKIMGLGQRSRDAFERAQDRSRKKLGKAIDLGSGITVIRPRDGFFVIDEAKKAELIQRWAAKYQERLQRRGMGGR